MKVVIDIISFSNTLVLEIDYDILRSLNLTLLLIANSTLRR